MCSSDLLPDFHERLNSLRKCECPEGRKERNMGIQLGGGMERRGNKNRNKEQIKISRDTERER